ncbi:hypothetical protein JX266_003625 [Neoarthrinium moseri]|nr:hypothetical protein JX266_003625 [Neoarthrinium moseri]
MVRIPPLAARHNALRCIACIKGRPLALLNRAVSQWPPVPVQVRQKRPFSQEHVPASGSVAAAPEGELRGPLEQQPATARVVTDFCTGCFSFPAASEQKDFKPGNTVTVHGFLGKRRDKSAKLTFCDLKSPKGFDVQIVSAVDAKNAGGPASVLHKEFRNIPAYSPVAATGILQLRPGADVNLAGPESQFELRLTQIQSLNDFPKDIIVSQDAVWPLSARHLQMRFDPMLRDRLHLRSKVNSTARQCLESLGFNEYETPILFKSTPEGAREFLVPTRRPGLAYALPQSPQQYKQILMASGASNYFQFARCFRDEDSRADRQPEFTQLDMEMSFATGLDVMKTVEDVIQAIFRMLQSRALPRELDGIQYTDPAKIAERYGNSALHDEGSALWPIPDSVFVRIKYQRAMSDFGIDKPDLRIAGHIQRIDHLVTNNFTSMITNLETPIVEAAQFKLKGTLAENQAFIRGFMDRISNSTINIDPACTPGVFIFDETKPLDGLSAFGHEGAGGMAMMETEYWPALEHGDLLIVHARKDVPFQGEGSTDLGRLRKAIYDAAVQEGFLDRDISQKFCWITDFPLFTPDDTPGEGQGGAAGLKATHHPFTAPLTLKDAELLRSDPLKATADHYDLVLNGVEIGGGSRRIHLADMQKYVFTHILQMPESGISRFNHLLEALRAGCPPHAGFALGWDRFIAMLCDVESVRDVITFPKNQKGEDLMVKSPSYLTKPQMETYHIAPNRWEFKDKKEV